MLLLGQNFPLASGHPSLLGGELQLPGGHISLLGGHPQLMSSGTKHPIVGDKEYILKEDNY